MSEPRAPYNRPSNVPEHWLLSDCSGCRQPVWYDPDVERETLAAGKRFMPVCSAECAMSAVQLLK